MRTLRHLCLKMAAVIALSALSKNATMKIIIALILLLAPWGIFVYAASVTGRTSTFVLVLTLIVSAVGFTMLIGGGGGNKNRNGDEK